MLKFLQSKILINRDFFSNSKKNIDAMSIFPNIISRLDPEVKILIFSKFDSPVLKKYKSNIFFI